MLWPAKARELLRPQYASVGGAARASLSEAVLLIEKLSPSTEAQKNWRNGVGDGLRQRIYYVDSYRRYCWPVNSMCDLKLAPFQLPATEDKSI